MRVLRSPVPWPRRLVVLLAVVVSVVAVAATSPPRSRATIGGSMELTAANAEVMQRYALALHVSDGAPAHIELECCVQQTSHEGVRLSAELKTNAGEFSAQEVMMDSEGGTGGKATGTSSEYTPDTCARTQLNAECNPADCERELVVQCRLSDTPSGSVYPVRWQLRVESQYRVSNSIFGLLCESEPHDIELRKL